MHETVDETLRKGPPISASTLMATSKQVLLKIQDPSSNSSNASVTPRNLPLYTSGVVGPVRNQPSTDLDGRTLVETFVNALLLMGAAIAKRQYNDRNPLGILTAPTPPAPRRFSGLKPLVALARSFQFSWMNWMNWMRNVGTSSASYKYSRANSCNLASQICRRSWKPEGLQMKPGQRP